MTIRLETTSDNYLLRATNEAGESISIDGPIEIGGQDKGFSPMQLVAAALGGCSSIDVLEILKKQRQEVERFRVRVEGERVDSTPRVFKALRIVFEIDGDVDPKKAQRAVALSLETYCSVAKMLEKAATITCSLFVNGETYDCPAGSSSPSTS